mgnify:CR=1 FL=1
MEDISKQKNENGKKKRTGKQKTALVFKIIGNVIFYAIIVFLFIFALMNIRGGKESFPNIFGKGFLSVQSDSMNTGGKDSEYEIESFAKGDLLIVSTHSGDAKDLKVGDVITWYDSSIQALNTHRIVYIHTDYSYVITQGDRIAQTMPFNKEDPFGQGNATLALNGYTETVSAGQIQGKVTSIWGGAGSVLDNLQKNWLFYFVIPVAVLLLIELFFVFKNILDYRNEKKKLESGNNQDALRNEIELEKDKIREELLKELQEKGMIVNDSLNEDGKEDLKKVEEVKEEKESSDNE